ncbi:hydroxymethylbilane synthase [Nakamurella sp. YIM 132087]|uniref:Porphobilinogen deaminase n=1 Tax=Nakamurella alba TaxID=2665158 RepID=A0A7K1FGG6_9ACTN|nr:hydroxymethylbilane synthase [Nakamurella alba]MTD13150.1 hydroxymethylbilane synthase [Nakamurella alba]
MTAARLPSALRIGTRGSALALAQSGMIGEQLSALIGVPAELVTIRTEGDVNMAPLTGIGGTGVFVSAVRDALLAGEVDLVVHSLKDLPTAPAAGIALGAVPPRESPADALVARDGLTFAGLPAGATVGTGSPRRAAQIRHARPDLDIRPLRGNIDTRVGRVHSGDLDAVVLAAAGLRRIGRVDEITDDLSEVMLPAPAQGALAVECRLEDRQSAWFASALAAVDDPASRAEVTAERNLLSHLEAGCSAPVGARAVVAGPSLTLHGVVMDTEARHRFHGTVSGDAGDAARIGRRLAEQLLADGAATALTAARER